MDLALTFAETTACLAPAPNVAVQQTVAEFIREGHYLRHLRKMKRLYAARQQRLADTLRDLVPKGYDVEAHGGFAVRLILPDGSDDIAVSNEPCNTAWRPCRYHRGTYRRERREACCWGPQTIPSGR